ncbi:flavin reductase family protein [Sediminitomix flava]|uniref:Flavin reductase (DIM6/NTAB) family NADH-FMN oxidoreductase RutF n=1 Tax=Sediminitomix flava TaxID=379075 RepID=A0A316A0C5_SEDFL|nr:flavin reductase [Sediminitomix flava]PWJ43097.1 flavin reductase (DIM6/NTAB) family NADH-FMN oxidoreductase RutF [Sediminitomix flava]
MHLTKEDIENEGRVKRLNLINSITGVKPANLIGTYSENDGSNLAIFSSVVHLGSHPALLGFILRPQHEVCRHTYENILETGVFTINRVHQEFIDKAHYTSAKFERELSEFEECQLTEEYIEGFQAPFVKESQVKLGMRYLETIPIPINDTMMVIGQIEHLIVPDHAVDEKGLIDLSSTEDVGIGGLNAYYALEKVGQFPYARPHEVPEFKKV